MRIRCFCFVQEINVDEEDEEEIVIDDEMLDKELAAMDNIMDVVCCFLLFGCSFLRI